MTDEFLHSYAIARTSSAAWPVLLGLIRWESSKPIPPKALEAKP